METEREVPACSSRYMIFASDARLFYSISFFMPSLLPASHTWFPLKNKHGTKKAWWGKIDCHLSAGRIHFLSEWTIAVTCCMGACISQGTGECPFLPQYTVHYQTTTKVFFHVSTLARTEGDKTEPFINRQGLTEKQRVKTEVRRLWVVVIL